MGLFDRFRKPKETLQTVEGVLLDGEEDIYVVGESHYQDALRDLVKREKRLNPNCDPHRIEIMAALVPEPTNKYDRNAIQVQIDGRRVGYLSREDAIAYRPTVRKLIDKEKFAACEGIIVGGREKGHSYGVVLFLPSVDD